MAEDIGVPPRDTEDARPDSSTVADEPVAGTTRRLNERKLLMASEKSRYKKSMLKSGWVLERTSDYKNMGKKLGEVRTYHWRFDPSAAANQLRRQVRTEKVLGVVALAVIVIGVPLALIFHQKQNVYGWTSSDIQGFVAKCESSGYVAVPSYCRCVADHVAHHVSYGTYQVQLQTNPVDVVITHNELTQGAGCTS